MTERWWHHDPADRRYDVLGGDDRRIARYVAKAQLEELVHRLEQAGETFTVTPTTGRPGAAA